MHNLKFDIFVPGHLDNATASKVVQEAERIGFNCIWTEDHILGVLGECWTRLASWASITRRIHIGPLVSCAFYRSPLLIAGMSSTINSISNGRFELGLGAGYWAKEFNEIDAKLLAYPQRLEAFEESILIIRGLLCEGKHFSHKGKYYSFSGKDFIFNAQKPMPPLLIGGKGLRMLDIVAKNANCCNFVDVDYEMVKKLLILLEQKCDSFGVSCSKIEKSCFWPWVLISEKRDTKLISRRRHDLQKLIEQHEPGWNWRFSLSGYYESCIKNIRKFVELGMTRFIVSFSPDQIGENPFGSNWSSFNSMELFWDKIVQNLK